MGTSAKIPPEFAELGFELEIGGGGAPFLSIYFPCGEHIYATESEGMGMPTTDNWMICGYPAGWDGEQVDAFYSSDGGSIADAVGKATAFANPATKKAG